MNIFYRAFILWAVSWQVTALAGSRAPDDTSTRTAVPGGQGFAEAPQGATSPECQGIFGPHIFYEVNSKPKSIFLGDLDGDQDIDVVVACYWREMVSVILNNGNGQFGPFEWYYIPYYSEWIDGGDFDNDGDIDLVTANSNDGNVSVLLNNGDGTFARRHDYLTYGNPRSVFAAELNGDNYIDLVTADYWNSRFCVLFNNGDGTFAPYVAYIINADPRSICAADLDGDLDNDLITSNIDANNLTIYRNEGNGNFIFQTIRPVGAGPFMTCAADFNGDNHIDLASANSVDGTVSILLNSGSGITFAPQVAYPVVGHPVSITAFDADRDGDLDLATANSDSFVVSILLNDGNGQFGHYTEYGAGINPYSIASADLDGDNDEDLAIALFSTNFISVLYNSDALPFAGAIAGQVTDWFTEPIADVQVALSGGVAYDSTDEGGAFLISDLCCDTYDLILSHPHYCDTLIAGVRVPIEDTLQLNIELRPRGFIGGTISDEFGAPIENIFVTLSGDQVADTSSASGAYLLEYLNAGHYSIHFDNPYYYDTTLTLIEVAPGETTFVDIGLLKRPDLEIWYGKTNGAPKVGMVGDRLGIDVYLRTAGEVQLDQLSLILGTGDEFIDSLLSDVDGQIYDPFTDMDEALFAPAVGSPPSQPGWSSQEFNASSAAGQSIDIGEPVRGLQFIVRIKAEPDMIGDTVICLGPGVNENGDSSQAWFDGNRLSIIEHFSPLYIVHAYKYRLGDANMYTGAWPPLVLGGDVTYLVNYFGGNPISRPCLLGGFWPSADVTGDCLVLGGDVSRLVTYFSGMSQLRYCPDYLPLWPTLAPVPEEQPPDWPGCENAVLSTAPKIIPSIQNH